MDTLIEKNKFENNESKFRTIAIDDMKRYCTRVRRKKSIIIVLKMGT